MGDLASQAENATIDEAQLQRWYQNGSRFLYLALAGKILCLTTTNLS